MFGPANEVPPKESEMAAKRAKKKSKGDAHANRPVSYKLHIRPMFTDVDVDHMNDQLIDLASYQDVKDAADAILDRVSREPGDKKLMPPESTTGPWPDEWVALFKRWIDEKTQP
jgi:hypothetical protein